MAVKAEGKKLSLVKRACGVLYGIMLRKGWPRWLFLAAVVIVFLIVASIIRGGADFRRNPSALAPRSAYFYAETRELDQLFRRMGDWPIWKNEMRNAEAEQWTRIQVALAGMLGNKVAGMGTRLPLAWLSGGKMAALCLTEGDEGGPESWAIYLEAEDAGQLLAELGVEPGFSFARVANAPEGVYELSDTGSGTLFFGAMNPWLIISSDVKPLLFAAESMRRPAFSLANSGVLIDWRRSTLVRGVLNPSYMTSQSSGATPFTVLGGWTKAEARLSFAGALDGDGRMDFRVSAVVMSDRPGGGGLFWPIAKFVLFWVGALCLAVIAGTVLVMLGWAGWLKALAAKAGIAPAASPAEVSPSPAFQEDTGAGEEKAAKEAEATKREPETSGSVSEAASPSVPQSESGIITEQE